MVRADGSPEVLKRENASYGRDLRRLRRRRNAPMLRFDGREIEVAENIDQWPGPDYRYFEVKDSYGNRYILRHDEVRAEWELTMFQSGQAGLDSLKG